MVKCFLKHVATCNVTSVTVADMCLQKRWNKMLVKLNLATIERDVENEIRRFVKHDNLLNINVRFANNTLKIKIEPIPPFQYIVLPHETEEFIVGDTIDHNKLYELTKELIIKAEEIASKTKQICQKLREMVDKNE